MNAPSVENVIEKGQMQGVGSGTLVSRLRRRYTRVVKMGDHWSTYLQIDHQGFCVVEQTTRARAQWFGKMLAVALDRMLSANAALCGLRGKENGTK